MDSDKESHIEGTVVIVIALGLIALLILPSIPPTSIREEELTDLMSHPEEYQGRELVLQGKIATWELRSYFYVYFDPHVFGTPGYWHQVFETRDRYAIPWVESHGWGWFVLRNEETPPEQTNALTQLYIHSDDHTGDGFFLTNQTVIVSGTLMKGAVPGMDTFLDFDLYGSYWYFEADRIRSQ